MTVKHLLFDWGNTLMLDNYQEPGPMSGWEHVEMITGVSEVLELLAVNVKLHVATNADESGKEEVRKALSRVGIADYFSKIYSSRDLGVSKPSPLFFHTILDDLNEAPESVCMVGDSLTNDVLAPQSCGMKAIWFNSKNLNVPTGVVSILRINALPSVLGF